MTRAVFLDRDGVVIESRVVDGLPYPVTTPEDVRLVDTVAEAVDLLRSHGFLLIVVSNQPDVARRTQQRTSVEAINSAIDSKLAIDRFYMCYHDDADGCECRKPRAGMAHTAAAEFSIDLSRSFMIGDRWRDVEMGARAGLRTVLIDYHYAERLRSEPNVRVTSPLEAARWIISQA